MTRSETPEREGELEEVVADRRRLMEFLAGGVAAVVLVTSGSALLLIGDDKASMVLGAGLLVLATGLTLVVWRIEKRHSGVARSPSEENDRGKLVQRLDAEREMLNGSWKRNSVPLLPGIVLIFAGVALMPDVDWLTLAGAAVVTVCLFVWLEWKNRQAARRLGRDIGYLKYEGRGQGNCDVQGR